MKFIISTHKNCFVYDYHNKVKQDILRGTDGQKWAYGISWHNDKMFIAWRHPHEILEYDQKLKFTGRKCQVSDINKVGDLHQITCFDEKIWVANTGHNVISIFNANNLELLERWAPHASLPETDTPYVSEKNVSSFYKHYNSIMFHNDNMYVNAHMTIRNPPSKVWAFTYPNRKFIRKIQGGISTHNIFFIGNVLTVCDSINNQILQPDSGKVLFNTGNSSFLRGVSMPPNLIAVGRSDICKERIHRNNAHGGVIFFKNADFKKPDIHWLGEGPVEEIRCLDEIDLAHPVLPFWKT
jgi:hypothetical protein